MTLVSGGGDGPMQSLTNKQIITIAAKTKKVCKEVINCSSRIRSKKPKLQNPGEFVKKRSAEARLTDRS